MKNQLFLIGNTGTDPLVNENGTVKIRLVTKEKRNSKSGEFIQEEWHTIIFRGSVAESVVKVVKKGMPLYIEGRVHYVHFENKEGKYVRMVVLAHRFQRLYNESIQ